MRKVITISIWILVFGAVNAFAQPSTGGYLYYKKPIHYILIVSKRCGNKLTYAHYRFRTATRALNAKHALSKHDKYKFVAMYIER